MQDAVTEAVRRQYEAYSYPAPIEDLSTNRQRIIADPSIAATQIWPTGKPREDLRILSAGCGTYQAAMLAYYNPGCSVLGVDLSEASLSHQKRLREKHNLTNLTLRHMSLLDIGTLQQEFDFIMCTGVLMAMPDPDAGINALKSVLAAKGRMYLMLYAKAGRTGVYLIQDALRRMGLKQTPEDVAFARDTLKFLPRYHFAANVEQRSGDELKGNSAFVDSFLHTQDIAHSVPDVMDFIAKAGLSFAGWQDNGEYFADRFLTGKVLHRVQSLPAIDQWSIIENMFIHLIKHEFYVCRPEDAGDAITFSRSDWASFVPHFPFETTVSGDDPATWKITHREIATSLSDVEVFLLSLIDGKRKISDIIGDKKLAAHPYPQKLAFAREFFGRMWRLGHVFYSKQ